VFWIRIILIWIRIVEKRIHTGLISWFHEVDPDPAEWYGSNRNRIHNTTKPIFFHKAILRFRSLSNNPPRRILLSDRRGDAWSQLRQNSWSLLFTILNIVDDAKGCAAVGAALMRGWWREGVLDNEQLDA